MPSSCCAVVELLNIVSSPLPDAFGKGMMTSQGGYFIKCFVYRLPSSYCNGKDIRSQEKCRQLPYLSPSRKFRHNSIGVVTMVTTSYTNQRSNPLSRSRGLHILRKPLKFSHFVSDVMSTSKKISQKAALNFQEWLAHPILYDHAFSKPHD